MKHSIYYFLCVFFVLSCNEKKQKEIEETEFEIIQEVIVDNLSEYPKVIDSLGLHDLYDSVKWQLYIINALDTPKRYNEREEEEYIFDSNIAYSSLELRFDSVYVDDTGCVKLYFEYYINDTQSINPHNFSRLIEYNNGLMFDLKYKDSGKTYICYLYKYRSFGISSHCEYNISRTFIDTTSERWYNPLQPEVIAYLNKYKNELHPWLYKEGVKRGVIKQ